LNCESVRQSHESHLRYQIERARRFAATLTNVEDRERFQGAADDYQREFDALSSTDATSADTSAPLDAPRLVSPIRLRHRTQSQHRIFEHVGA
jgi:hypothetical protein